MSGLKKLQLTRNIEIQKCTFPSVFQSYLKSDDEEKLSETVSQPSSKIVICSDEMSDMLKEVFYINTEEIDFSIVTEIHLKNRVIESIDVDKHQGICNICYPFPYRLLFYDIHIVKKINRRCLVGAYEVLKLKDLDLFEKHQLLNNKSTYINDMNHLKDYLVKFKAYNIFSKSSEDKQKKEVIKGLNLLDEIDTMLGLDLINEIIVENSDNHFRKKIINEYDKVALGILGTFLVHGDFTFNFKCVEDYILNKEILIKQFDSMLKNDILPCIVSEDLTKTEKLKLLMSKFVHKIDDLFKQSIINFEQDIYTNIRGELL